MRFRKIYLEISNICNLQCAFCPGTNRKKHTMTEAEFSALLPKLRPWSDYLYFHLMGEPLLHPLLERFLQLAGEAGFKVILTTNGTLLKKQQQILLSAPALHKINISLHAFESNELPISLEEYLQDCFSFGQAAQGKCIISYRLWNQGGADEQNASILSYLQEYFPQPWAKERYSQRLAPGVYLEHGDRFDWPNLNAADNGKACFCYGLRDQIGILCDGTVVPCCLDHDGQIPLGNLFDSDLKQILATPRASAIYDGFSQSVASEELCRHCGYATRFRK